MDKQDYRKLIAERKKGCSDEWLAAASEVITQSVASLDEFRDSGYIFAYMDMPGEVRMREFLSSCLAEGRHVALPRVEKRKMSFYEVTSFEDLQPGSMGIREPVPDEARLADGWTDVFMIMPGVAFDVNLHRIGYGGGCYDRFLEEHEVRVKAAVAYSWQVFENICYEEHDIRPDLLVTEERLYRR